MTTFEPHEVGEIIDSGSAGAGASFNKQIFTFPFYIMVLMKQVNDTAFCEWRGRFFEEWSTITPSGMQINGRKYVENTRAKFCNAVNVLYDVLSSHLNKEEKEKIDKINKEIEELTEEDYGTMKCIIVHRKLLRELHAHLKESDYHSKDVGFEAGNPFTNEWMDAQLDENGNTVHEKKEA